MPTRGQNRTITQRWTPQATYGDALVGVYGDLDYQTAAGPNGQVSWPSSVGGTVPTASGSRIHHLSNQVTGAPWADFFRPGPSSPKYQTNGIATGKPGADTFDDVEGYFDSGGGQFTGDWLIAAVIKPGTPTAPGQGDVLLGSTVDSTLKYDSGKQYIVVDEAGNEVGDFIGTVAVGSAKIIVAHMHFSGGLGTLKFMENGVLLTNVDSPVANGIFAVTNIGYNADALGTGTTPWSGAIGELDFVDLSVGGAPTVTMDTMLAHSTYLNAKYSRIY